MALNASPARKINVSFGPAADVPSATGGNVGFGDEFFESDTGVYRKVLSDATGVRVLRPMVQGGSGSAAGTMLQAGTGTLTGGNLDVAAGVEVTANSRILATYRTTAQTNPLQAPAANRVVGTPGNGAFRITNSVGADNASTVDWAVVN